MYLSVFAEICPHAGSVSSTHQYMISEEVNSRHLTCELASGRVVVVTQVSYHIIETQHLVTLVWVFQTYVKGDLDTSKRRAEFSRFCPSCSLWSSGKADFSCITSLPGRPSRSRRTRFTWRTSGSRLPRATRFSFVPTGERWRRWRGDGTEVLHDFQRRGARFRAVWVTDHATSAHHLIVRGDGGALDQQGNRDEQHHDHDDESQRCTDQPLPLQHPTNSRKNAGVVFGGNGEPLQPRKPKCDSERKG